MPTVRTRGVLANAALCELCALGEGVDEGTRSQLREKVSKQATGVKHEQASHNIPESCGGSAELV